MDRHVQRDKETLRLLKHVVVTWLVYIVLFVWHAAREFAPSIVGPLYLVTTGAVLVTNVRLALHLRRDRPEQ